MSLKNFFSFPLDWVEGLIARHRALTTEVPMAQFKRLHVIEDRYNGKMVKVGNLRRGARDTRPLLNIDGTYVFKTKTTGAAVNLKVVNQRGQLPKAEINVHGETVLVPVTHLVRSVKTDENGALVRA